MPKVLPVVEGVLRGRMVVVIHNYSPAKGRGPLDSVKRAFGAVLLTPKKAITGSAVDGTWRQKKGGLLKHRSKTHPPQVKAGIIKGRSAVRFHCPRFPNFA